MSCGKCCKATQRLSHRFCLADTLSPAVQGLLREISAAEDTHKQDSAPLNTSMRSKGRGPLTQASLGGAEWAFDQGAAQGLRVGRRPPVQAAHPQRQPPQAQGPSLWTVGAVMAAVHTFLQLKVRPPAAAPSLHQHKPVIQLRRYRHVHLLHMPLPCTPTLTLQGAQCWQVMISAHCCIVPDPAAHCCVPLHAPNYTAPAPGVIMHILGNPRCLQLEHGWAAAAHAPACNLLQAQHIQSAVRLTCCSWSLFRS